MTNSGRGAEKRSKYNGYLIICYTSFEPGSQSRYLYGFDIYKIRPEHLKAINPKVENCYFPAYFKEFGYGSDKIAIKTAQQIISQQPQSI